MPDTDRDFKKFFKRATGGHEPYPYQTRLATSADLPALVDVPTGLGKTAAVVLAWLWRRRFHPSEQVRAATPRRLAYCLPMRVLVEQTHQNTIRWLDNLGLLAGDAKWENGKNQRVLSSYEPHPELDELSPGWAKENNCGGRPVAVHLLMGGGTKTDWAVWPERDAILVGTQDMLLSRALNRGYGASRYRWPMEFGLLSNDCLWVFDEVQLMDAGVATSAQLQAFRGTMGLFGPARSVWMSATLEEDWLNTVDFDPNSLGEPAGLKEDKQLEEVRVRYESVKPLVKSSAVIDDAAGCAQAIIEAHSSGTRTLAIFNTVQRAINVYTELKKRTTIVPILIHSRFRPRDRQERLARLLADPPAEGTIVITTQVVEAGVDVSAKVLFTELAPWASLVQRFGRCNRRGEFNKEKEALVCWFDWPTVEQFRDQNAEKLNKKEEQEIADAYEKYYKGLSLPYEAADLSDARERLIELPDVSPASLDTADAKMRLEPEHVIRRRDMVDLFDTTPDLAGNDIDVSRFIRSGEELDVQVFWRDVPKGERPDPDEPHGKAPHREELCPVPFHQFRDFLKNKHGDLWRWNALDRKWDDAKPADVYPGQSFLVRSDAGGYDQDSGWNPKSKAKKVPVIEVGGEKPKANDDDSESARPGVWLTIARHTEDVVGQLEAIFNTISINEDAEQALRTAARWHDCGKAHSVFQNAIVVDSRLVRWLVHRDLAKAPSESWRRYERPHFRHELASAIAMLEAGLPDLAAYLAGAHHGKVRLSIRSLPGEKPPDNDPGRLYARGVWDGDPLPEVDLGSGVIAPECNLSLEYMRLGRSPDGQPSWAERMLRLRDDPALGPFRLAFLEALLRAADWRASRMEEREGADE